MKLDAFLEPWLLYFLGVPIPQAIIQAAVHTPWQHCLHLSTKSSPFLYGSWRSNSNVIVNDRMELSITSERAHWLCCMGYILILWRVTEKKSTVHLLASSVFSFSLLHFLWESQTFIWECQILGFLWLLSFGLLVAAVLITNGRHLLHLCPLNTLYFFFLYWVLFIFVKFLN